jgi:phosphatidate cytidylyltransferase
LWVFVTTWSVDIGAYFAGRSIGGPRLAPSISPNKTWAGLIGGMAAAAVFGGLWVWLLQLPTVLIVLAAPFAAAAQGGDLFESWLKRQGWGQGQWHLASRPWRRA